MTVVGGYLGAGKTTILNRLLAAEHGQRLGIIVNDFGSLGIDAQLLGGGAATNLIDLPNGCVCCTLGADLMTALAALGSATPRIDHVVVEVSGVADPHATAAWATVDPFTPGGIVVAVNAREVLGRSQDRLVGREVVRQIAAADLLVLTHLDEVDDATTTRVHRLLADTAPGVPVEPATHGDVPHDVILGPAVDERTTPGPNVADAERHTSSSGHRHADRYIRWEYTASGPMTPERLTRLATLEVPGLLRLKGWVVVAGEPGRTLVQRVGDSTSLTTRPDDEGRTRLNAIGISGVFDAGRLDEIANVTDHTGDGV